MRGKDPLQSTSRNVFVAEYEKEKEEKGRRERERGKEDVRLGERGRKEVNRYLSQMHENLNSRCIRHLLHTHQR